MFDLIMNPRMAERRPSRLVLFGISLGIVSSWLGMVIGNLGEVGHLIVALMCIGATPLMVHMIWTEEEEDRKLKGRFIERHWPLIEAYGALFIGAVLGISLVYVLLPNQIVGTTFKPQIDELKAIRSLAVQGNVVHPCGFTCVLLNNLQVLAFVLIFSFVYGAGAIYVITWNASVVGVLLGMTTEQMASIMHIGESLAYVFAVPVTLVRLLPHGIFEITGYLVGGIAGAMMSAAIVRGHIKYRVIWKDIASMIGLSIVLIIIGAFIETV